MPASPPIDYTNRDFDSLRQALLDLARYRLPEWTDRSPADLGMLMIDLFSYAADVVLYYQDRIANESFLHTAIERRSVMNLLRLIGYELSPPVAAATELTLTFAPPKAGVNLVRVPTGSLFATNGREPQTFEYLGPDLVIDLDSDQVQRGEKGVRIYGPTIQQIQEQAGVGAKQQRLPIGLPVRHSSGVRSEVLGTSTGEPNQRFALSQNPVLLDTLQIEVDEVAGTVQWQRRDSLLYSQGSDGRTTLSSAVARDYYVQFDEKDVAWIVFGDGIYGRRPDPQNTIRATYRIGGGSIGNVPRGAITELRTGSLGAKVEPAPTTITNPRPAVGGMDHETLEHAVSFGPLAFRSGQRAVTLSDYVALAQQAGGVAKVRADLGSWNQINLYVAAEGDAPGPVPEDLRRRLTGYFEDKRMAGTFLRVLDPVTVPIAVSLEIKVVQNFRPEQVRKVVMDVVRKMFAYRNVDFGQTLYLSDLYARTDGVEGVVAVTVTRFRRAAGPGPEIPQNGFLQMATFEIPYLEEDRPVERFQVRIIEDAQ